MRYGLGALDDVRGERGGQSWSGLARVKQLAGFAVAATVAALFVMAPVSSARADTQTRITEFEYDATTGLLTKEIIKVTQGGTESSFLETTYTHDAFGNRLTTTVTDPATTTSRASSVVYDAQGRFAVTATNALLHSETRVYDGKFGVVTTLTGPNGLDTDWQYDSFGRKTNEVRTDGTNTNHSYQYCSGVAGGTFANCPTNGAYVLISEVLAGLVVVGSDVKIYYDKLEREIRRTEQGLGILPGTSTPGVREIHVDKEYDTLGRVARVSEPYFDGDTPVWTVNTYDVLGRLVEQTLPDGSTISNTYSGLVGSSTNDLSQTRTETKNARGNVVKVVDAATNITTYEYDAFDNLTKVTDASLNVTTTEYDSLGRRTKLIDLDLGETEYTYNAFGELLTQEDAKDQVTENTYDALGRMTLRVDKDNLGATVTTATWTYDTATGPGIGKLAAVSDTGGYARSYTYDGDGRVATTAMTIDSVSQGEYVYTYDVGGRLETVKYPTPPGANPFDLTVKYLYNVCGHLIEVRNHTADTLIWKATALDARDQVVTEEFGNGVESERTYDVRGWLTGIDTDKGATNLQDLVYDYDTIGNVTKRTDNVTELEETFAYDSLNRLTSATLASLAAPPLVVPGPQTVTYDPIGNILTKSDVGTYTYGAGAAGPHAVTSITGTLNATFTYDANGNALTGNNRTLSWTTFDKPDRIERGTDTLDFTYGTERQRVTQTVNTGQGTATEKKTTYVSVGDSGHLEKTEHVVTGAVDHRVYIYASGAMVASFSRTEQVDTPTPGTSTFTSTTQFHHGDNLGSISLITDENGLEVERLSYDAWGERRNPFTGGAYAGALPDLNRGFTKHEHLEEVGLIHMNGRVYDSVIGRFLSADPHVQKPYAAQNLNRYSYVLNNPLAYTDPDGFFFKRLFKAIKKVFKAIVRAIRRSPILRTIAMAALSFALGPSGFAIFGAEFAGIASSAIIGGITDGVEGAIIGAAQAAVTYGIGSHFDELAKASGGSLSIGQLGVKAAAHGVTSGAFAAAQGGEFGPAALAGAFSTSAGGGFNSQASLWAKLGQVAGKAIIGGTASVIGGGKFQNGAASAIFIWALNDCRGNPGGCFGGASVTQGPLEDDLLKYEEVHLEDQISLTLPDGHPYSALSVTADSKGPALAVGAIVPMAKALGKIGGLLSKRVPQAKANAINVSIDQINSHGSSSFVNRSIPLGDPGNPTTTYIEVRPRQLYHVRIKGLTAAPAGVEVRGYNHIPEPMMR